MSNITLLKVYLTNNYFVIAAPWLQLQNNIVVILCAYHVTNKLLTETLTVSILGSLASIADRAALRIW